MSLNFKEIDLVLSELSLVGARIQKVAQPSYDTIILETFGIEGKKDVLLSVSPGACRIHGLSELPAKNERPLRFMECLRSRVRGGRIESIQQLASDRIVKIVISMPSEALEEGELEMPKPDLGKSSKGIPRAPSRGYTLYIRLWSGAGNMLLVDDNNLIIDALFRKPDKGESSGLPCVLEANLPAMDPEEKARKAAKFAIRELGGEGSFSKRVEAHYGAKAGDLSRDTLLAKAAERFEKRMRLLETKEIELSRLKKDYAEAERYKQIGDILMAGDFREPDLKGGRGAKSSSFMTAYDFYTDKMISIQIDSSLSTVENAQNYYEKFRKASSGLNDVSLELDRVKAGQEELRAWLTRLQSEQDPFAIAKALEKAGTVREKAIRKYPCISIERKEWVILVGRSAKENDELLRRHIRGSDLWLHARDYSGSYVFVKARKSKTFPLEIMLDAAALALYYSKARKNGEGDVYYTQAKYLRRVKDGPKGLVIPTLEKNLFVRLDEARIKELLDCSSGGEA